MVSLVISSPERMEELGSVVAAQLRAGDVVCLTGNLGAGKTTFTRGVGEALQVRGAVTSPTFVVARTHPSAQGIPLIHVDAYRLADAVELDDLDLDFDRSVTIIEWGEGMVDKLVDVWLHIVIDRSSDAAEDERTVTVTGHGARWSDLSWVA
ncbi:MAG: tRNA threonylcarbamoyladenosine biosynthesis protein TsaE [Actinomycetota bacterium]|jgi:tRNA threonylcarbamoyladenosine biosynthesis protein TsaE